MSRGGGAINDRALNSGGVQNVDAQGVLCGFNQVLYFMLEGDKLFGTQETFKQTVLFPVPISR